MNRKIVLAGLIAATALSVQSAEAQRRSGGRYLAPTPGPSITPYGGYMMFGDIADGPAGTSLTNSSGPMYGAQANIPLGSILSVVGNVAYSKADLRFGAPILGGVNFGTTEVWMYDAGFHFAAPTVPGRRSISPFLQLGAGAMTYDVTVAGLSRKATNLAVNAGVGADVPIASNISLRLLAKDYIGKFDVKEATGIDYDAKTSHNIGLSAGLKLSF